MSDASWDAHHYAEHTGHHRAFDGDFLERTPMAATDRVIDLGCGTGDFTHEMARLVPDGYVVGVDPQADFVDLAAAGAGPNESFVVGTAQRLSEVARAGSVDGVVSRAALHWAPCADHPQIAMEVRRVLRPGGWYRMDMGGAGNIERVVVFLDAISVGLGGPVSPWCFRSVEDATKDLVAAGLDPSRGGVDLLVQQRPFDRDGLLGWLTSQVLIAYEPAMDQPTRGAFRSVVEERLEELRGEDGTWDQTFVRLDVLAFAV